MARILYLVHRMPYPPDKGDKVRSYHLLRHLAARHDVLLGTFIDDPADEVHVPLVRSWCADLRAIRMHPICARLSSLSGLWRNEPLTLAHYRDQTLQAWIDDLAARDRIDAAVVFSSSMAQYTRELKVPLLVDFVDVDSAKWTAYADAHRWPLSWLYRREGRKLLSFERQVASSAEGAFFVTEKEADLFRSLAPECSLRVEDVGNGVDADYFSPDPSRASPFSANDIPIVFTGAMDYWPNVDAVTWFAKEVLPSLVSTWPKLHFHIVGRSPTAAVRALGGKYITVTGTVPDVRPYVQHAAVVVAPLRLARGIQNKVLEAMAMARPVVVAAVCAQAIDAQPGRHFRTADSASDYVREVDQVLSDAKLGASMGKTGRARVVESYGWDARLSKVDRHLERLKVEACT